MNALLTTIILLVGSNTFMTMAWYGHLKQQSSKPLVLIILLSWLIAFFEYTLMIPANRIGFNQAHLSLPQLKIMQEVITLSVFLPFAVFYMGQRVHLNFLWASLCLLGAVYFIFKPMAS
ncbi:hypothetical protein Lrub_0534 [Legionella rubrilucens]|uniref:Transmembrane protein n=1 Tax=Legionella rubrilucens TaxID=458 RepID=A0A0W0XXL9_9GAMM|nr:DMT family protein [Legionella rubrilucens]KTD49435.1 hypothetical protein Lrub_0534 [Legionella rubrilucens]